MMSPKARFYVAAGLFVAWLGWLVYLVTQTRDPVILSRPQFLVADLYVTARLSAEDGKPAPVVTIVEVLWTRDTKEKLAAAAQVTVADVPDSDPEHWKGEGVYLLPLQKTGDTYRLAKVPLSPGFGDGPHRLRIYPANDEALRQVRELISSK